MSLTNEQKMRREQGHNEKNQVEHERLAQLKDSIDSIMGNGILKNYIPILNKNTKNI